MFFTAFIQIKNIKYLLKYLGVDGKYPSIRILIWALEAKESSLTFPRTHHGELVDHSRNPAEVNAFIHHRYEQSVRVRVPPVDGRALRVTHPEAGSIPHVSDKLPQRSTV